MPLERGVGDLLDGIEEGDRLWSRPELPHLHFLLNSVQHFRDPLKAKAANLFVNVQS